MNISVRDLSSSLYQAAGWIKFIGVMLIAQGVFTAFTIVGIIVAWLPIWLGVLLFKSADFISKAHDADSEAELQNGLDRLATFFKIYGILTVIGLVVAFLAIIAAILMPAVFQGIMAAQQ